MPAHQPADDYQTRHRESPEHRALEFVQHHQGEPLEGAVRAFAEPLFSHDFAQIRVYSDAEAARVADGIGSRAFTVGSDIVFNHGAYQPASLEGRALLAHELTHAVQNDRFPSHTPPNLSSRSGDASEGEARHAASALPVGRPARVDRAPSATIAASPTGESVTSESVTSESVTRSDVRAADAEEWRFNHDDVDWGATAKEKQGMRRSLADQPAHAGSREQGLSSEGGASLPTLSLFDTTRAEGGQQVKQFEQSYAVFRLPMQLTLEALGRVQDLLTAGAPQVPPQQAANQGPFHKLKWGQQDSARKDVFGRWSDHTADLNKATDAYIGVYQRLQGAMLQWRSMKELITRKQKKAQLAKESDKLQKLEAPAKMIVAVVGVFENAMSAYGGLMPSASGAAEFDSDLLALESEHDTDLRSGAQRVSGAGGKVKSAIAKGAGLVGGTLGISMESVIQWAMGDADEIAGLKQSMTRLKADIEAAGERAEDFEIDAAAATLQGTTKENRAAALSVGTERTKSRESAAIFAGAMGGDNVDARLMTLCAEAYQELRMFAEKALEAYAPVATTLPAVQKLLSQSGHQFEIQHTRNLRRASQEKGEFNVFDNDYESLLETIGTARRYGSLVRAQLPEWRTRAQSWSDFFAKRTGSRLDEYGAQRAKSVR